jgi:hypothetical protein
MHIRGAMRPQPETSERSFRWCAMHYLTLWWRSDRAFIQNLELPPVDPFYLQKVCQAFEVSRSLRGHGPQRLKPLCKMLEKYRHVHIAEENVVAAVEKEVKALRKVYRENVLSATTKVLWILKGHPVVIYDSRACKGLRSLGLLKDRHFDYGMYYRAWSDLHQKRQEDIADAQKWLLSSNFIRELSSEWNVAWKDSESFINSDRFRNRLVDIFLWHVGEPNENGEASLA